MTDKKHYFHMKQDKRAVGEVLRRDSRHEPLGADYELVDAILEKHRPSGFLPRNESIYLLEDRNFRDVGITYAEGYVHEVEPITDVHRHDLAWVGALQRRHSFKVNLKDQYPGVCDQTIAENYWNGVATEKPKWEIVTKEATVVAVDDKPSPVCPPRVVY